MITIKNLKKSFPGVFAPVLSNINLSLKAGDFCVVIGSNGSGKSTLLKAISGEYSIDSGVIKKKGRIAQVTQDINLGTIPEMTLLENIALSDIKKPQMAFYNRYKNDIINKIKVLNIGLEKHIDRPLKFLSGGQRQTIATLMAITSGCEILLLDEHTAAIDPATQLLLMEYTARKITDLKLTTMMITHKLDDAIKYGNRLIMLHQGNIVLNITHNEKRVLKAIDLLALFHQYEDRTLLSGGQHDN